MNYIVKLTEDQAYFLNDLIHYLTEDYVLAKERIRTLELLGTPKNKIFALSKSLKGKFLENPDKSSPGYIEPEVDEDDDKTSL